MPTIRDFVQLFINDGMKPSEARSFIDLLLAKSESSNPSNN